MAENTSIEWCDHTFNPWMGCTKVSPGCDHCYAEARMDTRLHRVNWGPGQPRVRTQTWGDPVKWNKQPFVQCAACGYRCELRHFHAIDGPADFTMCPKCSSHDYHGTRARVFCASLADVFDNDVDPQWRDDLFYLIDETPNLDWLLLTKRIGNVGNMLPVPFDFDKHFPNVWIGATIVNQAEADRDIPKLLAVPAVKRFLSMEPLLGPVDLGRWIGDEDCHTCGARFFGDEIRIGWRNSDPAVAVDFETEPEDENDIRRLCPSCGQRDNCGEVGEIDEEKRGGGLHWVIVGGESCHHARPMHPDWARSLRDQCQAAGVAFFFKQWGEWAPGIEVDILHAGTKDGSMKGGKHICIRADGKPPTHGDRAHMLERLGKKAAGRLLDGRTWDGFPT